MSRHFLAQTSFATLSCVSSLAVAPMCSIWRANPRTPPPSSRSSICYSTAGPTSRPVDETEASEVIISGTNGNEGSATTGTLRPEPQGYTALLHPARRDRSHSYVTARESPEHNNEALPEATHYAETSPTEEACDNGMETWRLASAVQPAAALHVRKGRLMLSISLLTQVCVMLIESLREIQSSK